MSEKLICFSVAFTISVLAPFFVLYKWIPCAIVIITIIARELWEYCDTESFCFGNVMITICGCFVGFLI